MGLNRYDAKRDASESVIVDYLLACGAKVERLSQRNVPDLLVGLYGRWFLVECKTGKAPLEPGQEDWIEAARAKGLPVHVARSLADAEEIVALLARVVK